jgi:WD40 repeat protein
MLQPKKPDPTKSSELGKPLATPAQLFRIRYSPDGKVLAAGGSDGLVRRWDVSGKEPAELPSLKGHNGWVTGLTFGDAGLFTSDSWGRLTGWDAEGKQTWTVDAAHDGWARAVAKPQAALVATCGKDGFVRLWDVKGGKKAGEIATVTDTLSITFAPDGKSILAGDLFGQVHEFELSGKLIRSFEAKELYRLDRIQDVGGVRCLLFDAKGETLFAAGAEPKTGGFVECTPVLIAFDRTTGKRLSTWKGASEKDGYITDLAWHPDGYVIGTQSGQPGQGKLFFWKPGEEKPFFEAPKPNCHSVAISPDGRTVAASMTNANSAGNGRPKGGDYPANFSPIQFWTVPKLG